MLTLKKAMRFLNLTDKDANLSLTNLSVYLFLIEMLVSPFEWTNMMGLVAVLLNFSYERHETRVSSKEGAASDELTALRLEVEAFRESYAEIAKQAEETKRLLSTNAIGAVFGNRR